MSRKIIRKLKHDIFHFENDILKRKVLIQYPILPMQLIAILANYKTMVYGIKFNTYVDIKRLERIMLQVIRNHDLLRSSLISKKGKIFIQEHDPPEEMKLPLLDFSYKNDLERKKIIKKIFKCKSIKKLGAKQLFVKLLAYRNFFLILKNVYEKNIKYRIAYTLFSPPFFNNYDPSHKYSLAKFILIKNNIKEYELILYLHHLTFDDMSLGHLIEEIESSYYSDSFQCEKPLTYSSLTAELSGGISKNEPGNIIEKLNLKDHYYSSKSIIMKPSNTHHYLLQYSTIIKDAYQNELIEISIFMSAIICSKIFQVKHVPIILVSGNRKYQSKNYYNTVGLMQDLVPILINLDSNDYQFNKNNFNNYLNFLSTNGINIMYIIFNKNDDIHWKSLITYLNLEKLITAEPVLNLNIEFDQGKSGFNSTEETDSNLEYNKLLITKTRNKKLVNNLKKKGGFILWVDISRNSISFKLESLFPIEEMFFDTFSEEIREFIVPQRPFTNS